jgi:16S rRNA (uracil1498-N3)-methyltransferase
VVVVGPEGGLTEEETDAFVAAGAVLRRLGPTVLRTSTAGVVAAALLLSPGPRWSTE